MAHDVRTVNLDNAGEFGQFVSGEFIDSSVPVTTCGNCCAERTKYYLLSLRFILACMWPQYSGLYELYMGTSLVV